MSSHPQQNPEPSQELEPPDATKATTEEVRSEGATDFMGPGFLRELKRIPSKRRAYEFWYHPYTELTIFALIILSVTLLLIEVSMPTGEPVGWLGGLASGGITGWFFWADAVITLVFLVEYISKLWIAPKGRKWFFVRNSWIELIALLPVLRVFRLFRILRAVQVLRIIRVVRSVRLMRTSTMLSGIFQGFGSDLQQNRAGNVVVITYFLSAMTFGTIGVMVFEKGAGSGFETIADGLWWCVVTLSTVGYGDIVPETGGGRIVASIVVVLGLGFWSLVTGVFASTLIKRARRKQSVGLDILGIHSHILICGWNENGRRLVRDFRANHPTRHVVIISERNHLDIVQDSRIHHLSDDPTTDDALDTARLDQAATAVVLAEPSQGSSDPDVDARTLMICLAVRRMAPSLRVVVELLDEDYFSHARSTGATDIIVSHNYAGALISQIVQSPGLDRTYRDLFDPGRGSRFDEIKFPPSCHGKTYSDAASQLFQSQRSSLIGLRRDQKLRVAPDDEPTIEESDRAIIIKPVGDPSR